MFTALDLFHAYLESRSERNINPNQTRPDDLINQSNSVQISITCCNSIDLEFSTLQHFSLISFPTISATTQPPLFFALNLISKWSATQLFFTPACLAMELNSHGYVGV